MTFSARYGLSANVVDLYSGRTPRELRRTGFAPWDLALGGVAPGITRVLGPRSFEFGLAAAAADPKSSDDTLIVGLGKPQDVLASLATRVNLVGPKILVTNDSDRLVQSVRNSGWRYVLIDQADHFRINREYAVELDSACYETETVLFACAGYDSSHAGRIATSPWSYGAQAVRLVPELPSHSNGFFEVRVIDNPLASSISSDSVVRVSISATGRIELADSSEGEEALILEIR